MSHLFPDPAGEERCFPRDHFAICAQTSPLSHELRSVGCGRQVPLYLCASNRAGSRARDQVLCYAPCPLTTNLLWQPYLLPGSCKPVSPFLTRVRNLHLGLSPG